MNYKGKKAVVIGLADSGVAAARWLVRRGAKVTVTDRKSAADLERQLAVISGSGIETALGGHPDSIFAAADLVVVSPGVPKNLPQILATQARGAPVWSEMEMAAREVKAPVLAITGTNGKTTVTTLLGEIMKAHLGDKEVFVGGNIGTPLTELLLEGRSVKAVVVEVSSFQLEFVDAFHPRVAVILNITDDHLDRYSSFEEYADTKWRIFARQTGDDAAVLVVDDPVVSRMATRIKTALHAVSLGKRPVRGMWRNGDNLECVLPGRAPLLLPVSEVPLHGLHNLQNVMAAVTAALAAGVPFETARKAVVSFQGLPHRVELVRERNGVRYYDDSKGTNTGAVEAAVIGLDQPVHLLMGGQAKGCAFVELAEKIKTAARRVYAFGECREQLRDEMGPKVPVTVVETMREALALAAAAAQPGEAVLLSPACASFDQFQNYKDRGDQFKKMVMELPG